MNYYKFKLKVSLVSSNEENAEEQIKNALEANDIDIENIQCESEELYN